MEQVTSENALPINTRRDQIGTSSVHQGALNLQRGKNGINVLLKL
jgi:hypothetical protein